MDPQDIAKLKTFIDLVKADPNVIHLPELSFFKSYLGSLGANIPTKKNESKEGSCPFSSGASKADGKAEEDLEAQESEPESDVELDMTGVLEKDDLMDLEMGDPTRESQADEDMDKLSEIRSKAQEAASEGKLEAALELWTEAIKLNPGSAMFAKRAQVLVKLNKPANAIRDASKAIELNPDQPLAYRIRGRAHRLLGHWEEAASDLNTSLKIDFSEEANDWLKEVAPNAKKLQDHKRKYERKRQEKEVEEKKERLRRAREERQREFEKQKQSAGSGGAGFPGFGGENGMPGGGSEWFSRILQDPEIQEAFSDPEVAQAILDFGGNPMNLMKHQNNPKVMAVMNKIMKKMAADGKGGPGLGGMGGGLGGMFG